ncbi:MAG: M14 family metallocarboxypeptidase [Clostridia bacterium]|nr:M14 family metallocarboxypeptidase [Clostridia bacterium]
MIGKSVVGRDIPILSLGNGNEEILYAAAFHGNESITATVLLIFIEELCKALCDPYHTYQQDLSELIQKRKIHFVPIVNPDGCEISAKGQSAAGIFEKTVKKLGNMNFCKWSANARGVDINHNFNAKWQELHEIERMHGIYSPRHSRYGGEFPESEPETKAIANFCRNHKVIRAYAFHSQGEVIYWDFDKIEVKNAQKIATVLSDTSGYALDVPTGLAIGGGFKDWFISEFCRPAFTIEIGKGENPLPQKDSVKIYQKIKKMLFTSLFI